MIGEEYRQQEREKNRHRVIIAKGQEQEEQSHCTEPNLIPVTARGLEEQAKGKEDHGSGGPAPAMEHPTQHGPTEQQQESRKCAADALRNVQAPGHLASMHDPTQLEAGAQTYSELIGFLRDNCAAYDIAAIIAAEVAGAVRKVLPDLSAEYTAVADDLKQIHVALLEERGIPFTLPTS